jgi:archaellum component FlaG (FlaF/FlaG flagellin family)
MSASNTLLWAVSGITFALALVAVIDQSSLNQELASSVFRFDGNGTATLAPGVRRVIIGDPPAGGIQSVPRGSVYIGAAMLFSSGHSMERDTSGNLVLYAETVPGFRTRLATFTPQGAVALGEVPPGGNVDGGVFVTGRAVAKARDGWMMSAESNVTDLDGRVFATMGVVQNIEDPRETGIQFQTGDGTLTFADGRLYVGHVSKSLKASSSSAKVLVGGDVVIESELQALSLPVTSIDPYDCSTAPSNRIARVIIMPVGQSLFNGNEADTLTVYFEYGQPYTAAVLAHAFQTYASSFADDSTYTVACTETDIQISDTSTTDIITITPLGRFVHNNDNAYTYTCWCPRNTFEVNAYRAETP